MNCHSKKRQRTTGNYGKNKITTNIYMIKMSYRNIRPCRKTDKLSDNLCGVDL